ncbi:hypothetical protein MHL31_03375 [Lutibacter sp. A80]|uniref:hypothetical protein n=1 Tax=Lutibacter sp. A80 TaxID=2918453 RepID=UPI001F05A44F|nr:hypothetical protein [Lutibacter sp. A80]UMB61250.1 hypothetical protein MHL31_03375 [Lutibacter sp. A80]
MKKIIGLFIIIILVISCSNDDETEVITGFQGYYELVKMTGGFEGSETTGAKMEWQEIYVLKNTDSTFVKTRFTNDSTYNGNGTYTYKTIDNQKYIKFLFNENTDLIGNCTNDLTEVLMVLEDGDKLVSTWNACDGPGLEYQKIIEFCGTGLD